MKKRICLILAAALAAITFSRCEFLEVENYTRDMQQYDSLFLRESTTEKWLWNVYSYTNHVPAINNGGTYYASDEMVWNDSDQVCQKYHNAQYSASTQLWEDRYSLMYVGIRVASIFIQNVHKCTELSLTKREQMKGEALFLRGFFYFTLLRQYGPIPIVPDEGQDISLDYEELALPRASMDECVEHIVKDFEEAARVLPIDYASSWLGRATRGAALAMRAKTLIYAASPLFNGNNELFELRDDQGRNLVPQTYDASKWARAAAAAKEVIDMGVYELYTFSKNKSTIETASNVPDEKYPNGAGDIDPYLSYSNLFNGDVLMTQNPEQIWIREIGGNSDMNMFVQRSFPYSHKGTNDMGATLKQVDSYYMRDGRDKDGSSEEYPYITEGFTRNDTDPFVPNDCHMMFTNREPRFYASIAFNGSVWENKTADPSFHNFRCDYYRAGVDGKQLSRPYNYPLSGIGIRKYYNPDDSWDVGGRTTFKPQYEIRYADVLLWYAEALNEIPQGESFSFLSALSEQEITVSRDIEQMRYAFSRIRYRAGLPDLDDNDYHSQETLRDRIKRERRIEFFMEGSRYYDVRRWKDAAIDENQPLMGMNVDMKKSEGQKERFYKPTPIQISKVFMNKMYLWPISDAELKRNGRLTQNPGW